MKIAHIHHDPIIHRSQLTVVTTVLHPFAALGDYFATISDYSATIWDYSATILDYSGDYLRLFWIIRATICDYSSTILRLFATICRLFCDYLRLFWIIRKNSRHLVDVSRLICAPYNPPVRLRLTSTSGVHFMNDRHGMLRSRPPA